jgi:hypothetical protein
MAVSIREQVKEKMESSQAEEALQSIRDATPYLVSSLTVVGLLASPAGLFVVGGAISGLIIVSTGSKILLVVNKLIHAKENRLAFLSKIIPLITNLNNLIVYHAIVNTYLTAYADDKKVVSMEQHKKQWVKSMENQKGGAPNPEPIATYLATKPMAVTMKKSFEDFMNGLKLDGPAQLFTFYFRQQMIKVGEHYETMRSLLHIPKVADFLSKRIKPDDILWKGYHWMNMTKYLEEYTQELQLRTLLTNGKDDSLQKKFVEWLVLQEPSQDLLSLVQYLGLRNYIYNGKQVNSAPATGGAWPWEKRKPLPEITSTEVPVGTVDAENPVEKENPTLKGTLGPEVNPEVSVFRYADVVEATDAVFKVVKNKYFVQFKKTNPSGTAQDFVVFLIQFQPRNEKQRRQVDYVLYRLLKDKSTLQSFLSQFEKKNPIITSYLEKHPDSVEIPLYSPADNDVPSEQPGDPSEQPGDPSEQPGDPSEQPDDPSEQPISERKEPNLEIKPQFNQETLENLQKELFSLCITIYNQLTSTELKDLLKEEQNKTVPDQEFITQLTDMLANRRWWNKPSRTLLGYTIEKFEADVSLKMAIINSFSVQLFAHYEYVRTWYEINDPNYKPLFQVLTNTGEYADLINLKENTQVAAQIAKATNEKTDKDDTITGFHLRKYFSRQLQKLLKQDDPKSPKSNDPAVEPENAVKPREKQWFGGSRNRNKPRRHPKRAVTTKLPTNNKRTRVKHRGQRSKKGARPFLSKRRPRLTSDF